MKRLYLLVAAITVAGCSSHGVVHYSPYDLDRDGVLDARCPGMQYDASKSTLYGWRSPASADCAEQVPMSEENG